MEIKIFLTDYENDIQWQRTAQNFEVAEMNLDSLKRAYEKGLEKKDKEYEQNALERDEENKAKINE